MKKLIKIALVFLALLFVFSRFLRWTQSFSESEVQTVLFVPETIEQKGVLLARFHSSPQKVEVLKLDPDAQLEIVGGYGKYRLQAAYPLLALEEDRSDQFIRATLGMSLGTVLDQIVVVPQGDISPQNEDEAKRLLRKITRGYRVSIPFSQRFEWGSLLWDSRTAWVFSETNALEALNDAFDPVLSLEKGEGSCSVTIINTTGITGLAGRLDTLLKEDSISVVRTIDSEENLEETILLFPKNNDQPSCDRVKTKLKKIVPHDLRVEKVDAEALLNERADVVIKVGKDL